MTIATVVAHAKRIGKLPIVINDGPGFLVNRILLPYMNEALDLLCEGVSIKSIERAATGFGMPMGPLTLYDVVGLDTALYAGQTMTAAFPDRAGTSDLLAKMVDAGRLGKKSGSGFYRYLGPKQKKQPDPQFEELLQPCLGEPREHSPETITNRLFLPMLLEATRVLEEGICRDARDVDFGLIYGIGFPPFRGGLLFWADTLGARTIIESLKEIDYLGPRAEPTNLLTEMANSNGKFYG